MSCRRRSIALLLVATAASGCTRTRHAERMTEPPAVSKAPDFDRAVKPILEKQCRPCHFEGGIMHDKLPFDRAETIRTLGERLFTRIKDPEDQAAIRAFLHAR